MLNLFTGFICMNACLAACIVFKLTVTTWLDVTPSNAGKLKLRLTGKFELVLNPLILFKEFVMFFAVIMAWGANVFSSHAEYQNILKD